MGLYWASSIVQGRRAVYRKEVTVKSLRSLLYIAAAAAVLWVVSARPWALGAEPVVVDAPWQAPEFTHGDDSDWINSAPLKLADLEGKVVLIDFWTYGCWNCQRSIPWIKDLQARFGDRDLVVIGVHTPEFEYEAERTSVKEEVAKLALSSPVMIDNDFSYWNAMGNRYWPTFYLLDKSGRVRHRSIGEIRPADMNAKTLEAYIESLLAETV